MAELILQESDAEPSNVDTNTEGLEEKETSAEPRNVAEINVEGTDERNVTQQPPRKSRIKKLLVVIPWPQRKKKNALVCYSMQHVYTVNTKSKLSRQSSIIVLVLP